MRDYEWFKACILELTNIDLTLYKEKQMKRRIDTLIGRLGLEDYEAYVRLLRRDREKLAYFIDYITINVTEFFRTPEHWRFLEERIVPRLSAESERRIRVWSAGCSTGEEPYSLAMLLSRYIPRERLEILATDIDEKVLAKARAATYPESVVSELPEEYRSSCFEREGASYRIAPRIRECVRFEKLDLLRSDYPNDFDLVVCRNVLIYFTEEAKQIVFGGFLRSLRVGGCLFLGETEQIIYYRPMGLRKERPCFYTKVE